MKKSSWLLLCLIILFGVFLRINKIDTNYYFTGELGKELLYIRQFALNNTLPLVGMATSHEWLSYGPFYYWVMIPIFNLWNGNPFILFYSALAVSISGLILNYFVVKKIASARLAFFSTLIQSFSPILIWQTRMSKLHVFFFLIMPILMYLFFLLWNGNKKWVFATGILFGFLFSFHFSQIPILLVVAGIFLIKKDLYKIWDWSKFGLGMLIPNITLLLKDKDIALWLPYRIVSATDKSISGTLSSLNQYFGTNLFWSRNLYILGSLVFAAIFVHYIAKNKHKLTKDFLPFYLISSILVMTVANILHGSPPVHYFLPIMTTVPILFAIYLEKIRFWPIVFIPIVIINLIAFNKESLFFGEPSINISKDDFVPIGQQFKIADYIVHDAAGQSFGIKRIGPYDYFPENYSQNYKYLVLLKGGNLVDTSPNMYTIVEDPDKNIIDVKK